jgi:hypothetical protein
VDSWAAIIGAWGAGLPAKPPTGRARTDYFLAFLRAGADLAADLTAGLATDLAAGLTPNALGMSPSEVLSGQILKTGHFLQPTAMAMGHIVISIPVWEFALSLAVCPRAPPELVLLEGERP